MNIELWPLAGRKKVNEQVDCLGSECWMKLKDFQILNGMTLEEWEQLAFGKEE
ncbi:hypothetical protein [Paenibacillus sp. yr247]|uniref:hypothetical protein n=1 Tax=Paenibacillus sp. yr247 TaxID=1761880 RepID=UPI0015879EEA|nr:hypothetical protein [Paenibacillus sp. yr247]